MKLILNDLKAIALNSYAHCTLDPFRPFSAWESWYDYRYSQGLYPNTEWENVETCDRAAMYASDCDWEALTQHWLGKALYTVALPYYRLRFWLNVRNANQLAQSIRLGVQKDA